MKKICFLGALLCVMGCFVGCDTNKEEGKMTSYNETHIPEKYVTNEWRIIDEDEYMLADYEDEYECNNLKFGSSYFGKVSVSDEQKTNGSYSLKTEVYGYGIKLPANRELPELRILLKDVTGLKENPLLDIGANLMDYSYVSFDIYNAMDETYYAYFSINQGKKMTLELKQGWNSFEINFENPALSDFEEIETVSLYFQRWEIAKEKQVYYIDNVRVGR